MIHGIRRTLLADHESEGGHEVGLDCTWEAAHRGACCGQVRAEDFFQGYRKVDLQRAEVLVRVAIPFTRPHEYVREFKQAHRRDDDIAIVNAGMRVLMSRAPSGTIS